MAMKCEVTVEDIYEVPEEEVLAKVPSGKKGVFRIPKPGEEYIGAGYHLEIISSTYLDDLPHGPRVVLEPKKERWLIGAWRIVSDDNDASIENVSESFAKQRLAFYGENYRIEERDAK